MALARWWLWLNQSVEVTGVLGNPAGFIDTLTVVVGLEVLGWVGVFTSY